MSPRVDGPHGSECYSVTSWLYWTQTAASKSVGRQAKPVSLAELTGLCGHSSLPH